MKRITFFILSILCFTACNNDLEIEKPQTQDPQIELILPDAEVVSVYSTATVNECKINEIWVLEFNGSNTLIKYQHVSGSQIVVNTQNQAAQLMPQLSFKPATDGTSTIVCIANSGVTTAPAIGMLKSAINTTFPLTAEKYYSGGDYLPMYGEFLWTGNDYVCKMNRVVAKVQVQMGTSVSDATGNFSSENVTFKIYNSGDKGLFIQAAAPTYTTTAHNTSGFNLVQKDGATEKQTHAYIHEFPSSTRVWNGSTTTTIANNAFNTGRQHIILEKTGSPTTFYRLDFYNHIDSTFYDTKRNHHYIFTINKVRSEGYAAIVEAQNNPGSNIEYTIRIEDDSRYITSNGQYAIITSVDTIKIPGAVTNLEVAQFRYDGTIGSVTTNSVTATPSGSLSITAGGPITNSNKPLRITATAAFTQGTIDFKYGNIIHQIIVKKE